MKLAFCLFKYFPYGGLQRDFLRIAKACVDAGHQVDVYTMKWQGKKPDWLTIKIVKAKGITNHQRCLSFDTLVNKQIAKQHFDKVIGFNKMSGLDIYYAADGCFITKPQYHFNPFKRLSKRYRSYKKLENSVFSKDSKTQILSISQQEKLKYQYVYGTPESRFHSLPPGISKTFIRPENYSAIRHEVRKDLDVKPDEYLLLCIASSFKTKGVDRAIKAIKSMPDDLQDKCKLFVAGDDNPKKYRRLAKKLPDHIFFLGPRDDIQNLLFAADLLVHFARLDNTGTVILEAIVAGVPVIATALCGYTPYVLQAQAGEAITTPFQQRLANEYLQKALNKDTLAKWEKNALAYSAKTDLYGLIEETVKLIETL